MASMDRIKLKQAIEKTEQKVKKQEAEKKRKELSLKRNYPPLILTMLKRLKRIDAWNGVASYDPYETSLIVYYKLMQFGMKDLHIMCNVSHSWVEFLYNDIWYIFDPICVSKIAYGDPIKPKNYANPKVYGDMLMKFNNPSKFIKRFEKKISFSEDEAKIEAMEDPGLQSVMKLKYH